MKPFVEPRKSKSNFPSRKNNLETSGCKSDENGSDSNSDFGEDQYGEGEFLMSDMDDKQKNFPKQKLRSVSNEGKRKPLSLKGSQQHRREMMTNMSKFTKLKLEKSTTRITGELSADEVFGKMIAAEIKQLPGNVKPLAKHKINDVIFKYQMHSNQSAAHYFIFPPITPTVSFTPKHFSLPV